MVAVIVIGIIILIIWVYNSNSSSSSSSTTTYKQTESYKAVITKPSTPTKTISVSPKTITTNPDLKLSLIDGELRTFQNYYIGDVQYTFGFPKENCRDKRVWIGIGKKEVERISYDEAMNRINSKSISQNNTPKQIETYFDDDLPF